MARRDPLSDPEPLIRRVYSYVAFRIGAGADAEDVTSTVIERAIRYRKSYDPAKGDPRSWLLAIARTCVDDHLKTRVHVSLDETQAAETHSDESTTLDRLSISAAVSRLDGRDRDLIALRYGADLSSKEIGKLLGMTPSTVDVALHRSKQRLRASLTEAGYEPPNRPSIKRAATEPLS